MKVQFPVEAVARGEGLLLKTARATGMPGLNVASIDGGVSHSMLTTSVRRGRYDNALQRFRTNLRDEGFIQIDPRHDHPEDAIVLYSQQRQVYVVLTFTKSFVDIKLEFRATATKVA